MDTYKATKKEIKDWTITISQKKNPEWLILQIVTPDQTKQTRSGLFGGSVFERLKADFSQGDKRTRYSGIVAELRVFHCSLIHIVDVLKSAIPQTQRTVSSGLNFTQS